ncbi:abscisic acid receptor PYL4-like [Solanum dulcamara]|uniref:abscisic acid receptor PYL4-like n=1 Tax=Solanum dulcamara TaxID=45834 RepID=UPI0024855B9B|nr:abscisic acid receptor PYL4-like [Solanum dulcamara]
MPPKSSLLLQRINPTTTPTTSTTTSTSCRQLQRRTPIPCTNQVPDSVVNHHTHSISPNQCCSAVIQRISAPISSIWSVLRRFDNPQAYKHFVKSCHVIGGDGNVGTLREVRVISGLPAANSMERLEILDEECHVISFSVVGGDHRLVNYRSVTSLHSDPNSGNIGTTIVVESYVVDIPNGNTKEETCVFVDTIVKCNLQSLAQIAENLSRRNPAN